MLFSITQYLVTFGQLNQFLLLATTNWSYQFQGNEGPFFCNFEGLYSMMQKYEG